MPVLTNIVVAPPNGSIETGWTQQFTAIAVYSNGDGADVTTSAAWSSSDPTIVTVDSSGLATAVGFGSVTVSGAYGGFTGQASLVATIPPPPPPPSTPDYAALLALAQQQMALYLSGQAVVSIDNPQLGRVEYNRTNISDLQRLINDLTAVVSPELALATRRRPISIEAWP